MNRMIVAGLISLFLSAPATATNVYDAATNRLTVDAITLGNTTYTNVVVTVGSVISVGGSGPAVPVTNTCLASNFTATSYVAITAGMTVSQINQVMGCAYTPSATSYESNGEVEYWWNTYCSFSTSCTGQQVELTSAAWIRVTVGSSGVTVGTSFKSARGF
ncbi:MAG: hypothetical protein WC681_14345 [Sterolibacterium sp.]|jgi:hypothetical protein